MRLPTEALKLALNGLRLSAETEADAKVLVGDLDRYERLYQEWLNDVITLRGTIVYRDAMRRPDSEFLAWLEVRLKDPYHLSPRALKLAQIHLSSDAAKALVTVKWRQEIAWAKRMRLADEDTTACLAGLWLKAAERSPIESFRAILAVHTDVRDARPSSDFDHGFDMLSPQEIERLPLDRAPDLLMWLKSAEATFGGDMNRRPGFMRKGALQARREAKSESDRKHRRRKAEMLRRNRPALSFTVLGILARRGLSADDIFASEQAFVDAVAEGRSACPARSDGTPEFLRWASAWSGQAPAVEPLDLIARGEKLRSLSPIWLKSLPESVRSLGGAKVGLFNQWVAERCNPSSEPPPADPAIDFALWLLARRSPRHVSRPKAADPPPLQGSLF
jgi:hypothetical protein